jgi:hypothetical protein
VANEHVRYVTLLLLVILPVIERNWYQAKEHYDGNQEDIVLYLQVRHD